MNPTKAEVAAAIAQILPDIVATRHHLHRNPELSGEEAATGAYVASRLRLMGVDAVQTGLAGHGVVAHLAGAAPGPTLALRADMDALPIQETADRPYRSCVPGVMHACGHDGHTATLLGAAAVLTGLRSRLAGTIRFVFQPAEETVGGADALCAAGVLEGVDGILALHGWPALDIGRIGVRSGPMMASADRFELIIEGRGGHAAYPHLSIDPIPIAAQVIQALQTVASRETSPLEPVVVSVTQLHAGTAYNVIPGQVTVGGTVRCLSNGTRAQIPAILERIIGNICAAGRATYRFDYVFGPPVTVNQAGMTALIEEVGQDVLGQENVVALAEPSMGAEDFAYYLDHVPGAMFRLGVGLDVTPLHTPTYNFSDGALPHGIAMMSHLALRFASWKKLAAHGEMGNSL